MLHSVLVTSMTLMGSTHLVVAVLTITKTKIFVLYHCLAGMSHNVESGLVTSLFLFLATHQTDMSVPAFHIDDYSSSHILCWNMFLLYTLPI